MCLQEALPDLVPKYDLISYHAPLGHVVNLVFFKQTKQQPDSEPWHLLYHLPGTFFP